MVLILGGMHYLAVFVGAIANLAGSLRQACHEGNFAIRGN